MYLFNLATEGLHLLGSANNMYLKIIEKTSLKYHLYTYVSGNTYKMYKHNIIQMLER